MFCPDFGMMHDITNIFKRRYTRAWTSWTEVQDTVCDMWFKDFGAKYKWLPKDDDIIRKIIETKGSGALSNNLFKVCDEKNKGEWIHPDMLEQNGMILPSKQSP